MQPFTSINEARAWVDRNTPAITPSTSVLWYRPAGDIGVIDFGYMITMYSPLALLKQRAV